LTEAVRDAARNRQQSESPEHLWVRGACLQAAEGSISLCPVAAPAAIGRSRANS